MSIISFPYEYFKVIFNNYNVYWNFGVSSIIYSICYPILDKLLLKISSKYNNYKYSRRYYIITNILKSGVLILTVLNFCLITVVVGKIFLKHLAIVAPTKVLITYLLLGF